VKSALNGTSGESRFDQATVEGGSQQVSRIKDIMDAADARGRCSEEKEMGQAGA
jgi:hypothetical protein